MKKILLASTILVGSTGLAAADVTFSGAAYMGLAYSTFGGGTFTPEVSSEFTAGMMTTTDGGLEASASVTVSAGNITVEDDHTDGAFATASTGGASISDASVSLGGDWGTFTMAYDNDGTSDIAALTEPDVTFTYANSWGDFGMSAYYTWAGDLDGTANGLIGLSNGDFGAHVDYTMGDYMVYGEFDWDESDGVTGDWAVGFGGTATFSGFTVGADVDYENFTGDWDWAANASYTTGAFTIGGFVEDDGVDDQIDFGATGSYDLGGGVSVDAAVIYDADTTRAMGKLGVTMAF